MPLPKLSAPNLQADRFLTETKRHKKHTHDFSHEKDILLVRMVSSLNITFEIKTQNKPRFSFSPKGFFINLAKELFE